MRCADFRPILPCLKESKCIESFQQSEEYQQPQADEVCQQNVNDKLDRLDATPKCWTPKYSPAYKAGHAQAHFGAPHLLPPPPPGAASASVASTAAAATPTQDKSCRSSTSCRFFNDLTPTASPCARTPTSIAGDTPTSLARKQSSHNSVASRLEKSQKSKASRIDQEHVPRPSQEEAVREEGGSIYQTTKYQAPPGPTQVCTILDTGSCSCEFMRCTLHELPAYPTTANTLHVPIAIVSQPFAELTCHEKPVPVVNLGEAGPMRCDRCKAYVNPFFTWQSRGRTAVCNFCEQRLQVPEDYVCSLNDKNLRHDIHERPELQFGTVDYIAPRDYTDDRLPGVPVVVLVLDISKHSVQSGLFSQVLSTLRQLVGFLEAPVARVAFITFDQLLHFYTFEPSLGEAREIIVADIDDPFVPCSHEKLCVNVAEDTFREQFDSLLSSLSESTTASNCSDQAAGGCALKVAAELAGNCGGGHVLMFHAALPNTGLGALRNRDDISLYGQPEGGGLFKQQHKEFLDNISAECLDKGVAVSAFCTPAVGVYTDIATLSVVPRRTGGDICFIPGFDPSRDGENLHYNISRTLVQEAAYSAVFKFRCSKGLTVREQQATWDADVDDKSMFRLSRVSVDASIVFEMTHLDRLEGRKYAFFQAACLYTDKAGVRLIRVQTLRIPTTTSLNECFRYSDVYAVTCSLLRQAAAAALRGNGSFKEKLTSVTVDILHAYRVNCARRANSPQLILPEALKLLPLYISSLRKMAAFRSGSGIRVDDRVACLISMLGMPLAQLQLFLYPSIYQLAPFAVDSAGRETGVGDNVYLPPTVRCRQDQLSHDQVYLVDNGLALQIYIRSDVSQASLEALFGTSSVAEVPAAVAAWTACDALGLSPEGYRAFQVCQQLRRERYRLPWLPLVVVLPGTAEETRLLGALAEDPVSHEMGYVDYLVHLHQLVMNKLDL